MAPPQHPPSADISKRAELVYDSFWWSPTGYIVKWAIMAGIFLIITVWFVGGYLHAQKRMKKGLPPLKYHRFLISRAQRAQFDPNQRQFAMRPHHPGAGMYGHTYQTQNPDGSYTVHTYYPEPPPLYNGAGGPPAYTAEQKEEMARQESLGQGVQYPPPAGPPPSGQPGHLPPGVQQGSPGIAQPGVQQGSMHAQSGQQDPGSGLRLPQVALNKIKAFKLNRS